MKTEILVERLLPSETNIITESSNDGKTLYLKGVLMQAEIKNRNGRIYPLNEMVNAVATLNESIKYNSGIPGELDHPQNNDLTINLRNASHIITELYMDGNNVQGKCKLLDTPMGHIAKELIKSGLRVGMSSRGAGHVNEQNIVENFNLVTIDIVATPSAAGATPASIYESLQTKSGVKILTLAEQLQQDSSAQKYFAAEFKKFLFTITSK